MRGWLARLHRTVRAGQDPLFAGLLLATGEVLAWSGAMGEGRRIIVAGGYALTTASLALRRRQPLGMAVLLAVGWIGQAVLAESPQSILALVIMLVAAYSVGAHAPDRRSWWGLALLMATAYVGTWLAPDSSLGDRFFTSPVLVGGPWLAGRLTRRFRDQARELRVLNRELERRRTEDAERAALAERTRIARELHDVVAHHLSLMVLQAGAAERVMPSDPERARSEIADLRRTGQAALVEMRRLLDLLRSDDSGEPRAGRTGLDQLDDLVASVCAAGLRTRLVRQGTVPPLPAGHDLAAYRIVQEALTNALKHAAATECEVLVGHEDGRLVVEVSDNGRPPAAVAAGHGLIGMRERASYLGGALQAGAAAEGGWRVRLTVPLPEGTW